jgi:hypothetical protein
MDRRENTAHHCLITLTKQKIPILCRVNRLVSSYGRCLQTHCIVADGALLLTKRPLPSTGSTSQNIFPNSADDRGKYVRNICGQVFGKTPVQRPNAGLEETIKTVRYVMRVRSRWNVSRSFV